MPENAWQESRDTGLRHLSVGVALYAGLCSGFILLYAPAFLSLLSLFERKEGIRGGPAKCGGPGAHNLVSGI